MKRLFTLATIFLFLLTMTACHRVNEAGNLRIESHDSTSTVIKYIGSSPEFGELYIELESDSFKGVYVIKNKKYALKDYYIQIDDTSVSLKQLTKSNRVMLDLKNPIECLVDGTPSSKKVTIFVEFEDSRRSDINYSGDYIEDSKITLTFTLKELIELANKKKYN